MKIFYSVLKLYLRNNGRYIWENIIRRDILLKELDSLSDITCDGQTMNSNHNHKVVTERRSVRRAINLTFAGGS